MQYCQFCGVQNRDGAKFCIGCGRPFATQSAPPPPVAQPIQSIAREKRKLHPAIIVGGVMTLLVICAIGAAGMFLLWDGESTDTEVVVVETAVSTLEPTAESGISVELPSMPTEIAPAATDIAETIETILTPQPEGEPIIITIPIVNIEVELPRMSDAEEIKIGEEIARDVESDFGVYHNAAQEERVARIGSTIALHADRPHMPYTFTILDTAEINAFAVPGGFIYVTRGMLDFAESDDELASVIGHEIAHVGRRHSAEQIEALAAASALGQLVLDADTRIEDIYETEAGTLATEFSTIFALNGWGRENEFEADEYGVIYMAQAGYEPEAAAELFTRMEREFPDADMDVVTELLQTHPPFADRIRKIREVIAENDL